MFGRLRSKKEPESLEARLTRLKEVLAGCDAVVIGAGSGLSTAAGFTYGGARFQRYFPDFIKQYGLQDMYSGGFFPFPEREIYWAWWSRNIYVNRYMDPPKPVYGTLLSLVKEKEYFVLTTNVDHCFQKAGFDKERLFYTQGDYGLFQSDQPAVQRTYDNVETVRAMIQAQGFVIGADGDLSLPEGAALTMRVPPELFPVCPDDGRPMIPNLRVDDQFVEDAGWHAAAERYAEFLSAHEGGRVLFWELGVGGNTPVIIKFPFWRMTEANRRAVYACMNLGEAAAPDRIAGRSICIDCDIADALDKLKAL